MSRTSDEPDFGEIKGLLRRLETNALASGEGAPGHEYSPRADNRRPQHGLSSGAALFLVANTMMATATITSIAWYLFQSSAMLNAQRLENEARLRLDASSQRLPEFAPRPPQETASVPSADGLPRNGAADTPSLDNRGEVALAPSSAPPAPGAPATQGSPAVQAGAPRLVTQDAVQVRPGETARLPIRLEPAAGLAMDHIAIRGLPDHITLNRGSRSDPNGWTVPAADLGELELAAAADATVGRFDIVIAARSADAHELAWARSSLSVAAPIALAPAAQPPVRLDESVQTKHIAKARELLDIGQVGAARLLLERVSESGNAEAALLLGDTYDPVHLFRMGARGMVGDTAKATFWYEKADELGSPAAKARIIGLKQK